MRLAVEPEATEAIKIADKHLAGKSPEQRLALAKDILLAIKNHAEQAAITAINEHFASKEPQKH
jgi:hypothetical protein